MMQFSGSLIMAFFFVGAFALGIFFFAGVYIWATNKRVHGSGPTRTRA
jgi:hypothetical protein